MVDDHPVFREGLRRLFEEDGGLCICGEAGDRTTAMSLARSARPDVALIDITLKEGNGLDLLRELRNLYPGLPMLAISMHDEVLYAGLAQQAGANGYVMKEEARDKILVAVRKVLGGGTFFSDRFYGHAVSCLGRPNKPGKTAPLSLLTNRELEVFGLIGKGRTTQEIARKLSVSAKTVEGHRVNIKNKLGVRNVTELVGRAANWVELNRNPSR